MAEETPAVLAEEAASDAPAVTSTVEVVGTITIRTYSDGAVQRNVWESNEQAEAYAASVAEVEGAQ